MKEYENCYIEIVYFEDDIVRTSIILPDDEFGSEVGEF